MKKYLFLSIGSYAVAFLWFVVWINIGNALVGTTIASPRIGSVMNGVVLTGFMILLLIGVFFGLKSNKSKESLWAGNLCTAVGIVIILSYLLLLSGFMGY